MVLDSVCVCACVCTYVCACLRAWVCLWSQPLAAFCCSVSFLNQIWFNGFERYTHWLKGMRLSMRASPTSDIWSVLHTKEPYYTCKRLRWVIFVATWSCSALSQCQCLENLCQCKCCTNYWSTAFLFLNNICKLCPFFSWMSQHPQFKDLSMACRCTIGNIFGKVKKSKVCLCVSAYLRDVCRQRCGCFVVQYETVLQTVRTMVALQIHCLKVP
jgi:hypothetical protein